MSEQEMDGSQKSFNLQLHVIKYVTTPYSLLLLLFYIIYFPLLCKLSMGRLYTGGERIN